MAISYEITINKKYSFRNEKISKWKNGKDFHDEIQGAPRHSDFVKMIYNKIIKYINVSPSPYIQKLFSAKLGLGW